MARTPLTRLANRGPGDWRAEPAFLADCLTEDWERIERHALRRRFAAGEEVVRAGEEDRSLLIVLSGVLEFVVEGRIVSRIEAPTLVGEVGFFDPGPRSGTLRASVDGELLQLGFAEFEALAAASPALARTILLDAGRIVARRLRRSTTAALGDP